MKKKLLPYLKLNGLFYLTFVCLLFFVFVDPFSHDLANYLEKQIASVTLSLGLLLELKTLVGSSSSSHVPIISGASGSTIDTISTAIQYLSWSDILITSQLILITLSKSIIIKIALIIAFLTSFISKYKTASLKVIVLLLLINPGLPAYVIGIKYLAQEAKLDFGNDLTQDLKKAHENYKKRELELETKEALRNKRQKEKAELKGEDKISALRRIEDKATDDFRKVDNKIVEGVSEAYQAIKIGLKDIIIKSINLFTSVLIQFILLPFLYFFGLFTLFKKFLCTAVINTFLEKIIVCEAAIIAIILAATLI